MINFTGITTEACKNIVLAGIGSITIADEGLVQIEDLGAGFFFRDEDVGKQRVHAGRDRINSLNPRVQVIGISEQVSTKITDIEFLKTFNVVCLNDSNSFVISEVNTACRKAGVPLFVSGCLGLDGYLFVDLIDHTYLRVKDVGFGGEKTQEKKCQKFVHFSEMLEGSLNHVTPRRHKKISPMLLGCLALFQFQASHEGMLPQGSDDLPALVEICDQVIKKRNLQQVSTPTTILERLCQSSGAEFVATCAIVGSVMSQEVLNVLGAQQPPVVNLFVFDGQRCAGDVYALGALRIEPW
ncbi:uncharacterized protein MELLADRAFT_88698 [Melampsora larici-populina 98AG31]|uniref:THIF-type NAD/FAD binding fold domain-containing protein n=1 Tax=Melampsora larici-populina (strain 98AG31 / pathotype 3-4-7) TaxID=747676 RepID=F4RSN7_MELLP|nr:uncharacterized protein MELLADRAFT_88698 [Melampsora larici-populina 98AG31]EGG04630.1 hypothetical protein MELLADRAFT_88698 [Melampsora larici-populina 98AG31]